MIQVIGLPPIISSPQWKSRDRGRDKGLGFRVQGVVVRNQQGIL